MAIIHVLDKELDRLVEALELAQGEDAILQALRHFTAAAGFNRFAYLNLRGSEIRTFSNYPSEWQHIYLKNHYTKVDPVVIAARRSMQTLTWSQNDAISPESINFYSQADDFGIRSGISIPVRAPFGHTAMLTLASEKPQVDFAEVHDILRAATAVAFAHVNLQRIASRSDFIAGIKLTPREATCMYWSAQGKTKSEIGSMLDLTERGVREHLDKVRRKLGAKNVAQAVRIAVELKLI